MRYLTLQGVYLMSVSTILVWVPAPSQIGAPPCVASSPGREPGNEATSGATVNDRAIELARK